MKQKKRKEICKNCSYKEICSERREGKNTCDACGQEVTEFHPTRGYYEFCLCLACYNKFTYVENHNHWIAIKSLIKTKKIHCIQCRIELNYKTIISKDNDHITIKCPNCNLLFAIYHDDRISDRNYNHSKEKLEWLSYKEKLDKWILNGRDPNIRPIIPIKKLALGD